MRHQASTACRAIGSAGDKREGPCSARPANCQSTKTVSQAINEPTNPPAVALDQDVLGLEVGMHQAQGMHEGQRGEHLAVAGGAGGAWEWCELVWGARGAGM